MSKQYLIIGNGAAGVSAAEAIRKLDRNGRVSIITDELTPLYSRPGIAYYVLGRVSRQQLMTRTAAFYHEHRFELINGRVQRINFENQTAILYDSRVYPYDVLLLATGSSATPPTFPGHELEGVLTFDTVADADQVIKIGRKAKTAVIVGGGITAMELAEGLHHQRCKTHMLQRRDRLWPRLFDADESAIVEQAIVKQGIKLHYRAEIDSAWGKRGKLAGITLKSGVEMKCQALGVAIGVRPNIGLVQKTAVSLDRGVLVNEYMQTNVPTLFAAGDVAQAYDRWTKSHQLDVLWASAINEGRIAGANMVAVANGRLLNQRYQKNSPFNATLLFGIHITVIGRMGSPADMDQERSATHLSRGSSQVWTTPFAENVQSAWDNDGTNRLRLAIENNRLIGALIMGDQSLADPLRHLIENEVDLGDKGALLLNANGRLPQLIRQLTIDS
jgi:NAD(P)H-nitrite reductase large subunit